MLQSAGLFILDEDLKVGWLRRHSLQRPAGRLLSCGLHRTASQTFCMFGAQTSAADRVVLSDGCAVNEQSWHALVGWMAANPNSSDANFSVTDGNSNFTRTSDQITEAEFFPL